MLHTGEGLCTERGKNQRVLCTCINYLFVVVVVTSDYGRDEPATDTGANTSQPAPPRDSTHAEMGYCLPRKVGFGFPIQCARYESVFQGAGAVREQASQLGGDEKEDCGRRRKRRRFQVFVIQARRDFAG